MFRNRRHVPALAVIIVAPALFSDCLGAEVPGTANGEATGDPPGSQVVEPGLPTRGLLRIGSDSLRTGGTPSEIAFSPDGKSIAVAEGWPSWVPGVPFFDSRDGRRIKQLRVPDPVAGSVKCLAFSDDGTRLIWGESSGNVALWDLTKNRMLLREKLHHGAVLLLRAKLHDEDVECVAFSADGKLMASGGTDGVVHLRQVESPERTMRDFNVGERLCGEASLDPAGAHCLTFTPDGTRLIAGAGLSGSIFIWQVSDGRLLREIDGEAGQIPPQNPMLLNIPRLDRLQVTPDGRQLIVTGHKLGLNPDHPDPRTRQMWVVEVRFLDLETGECVKTLDGGKEPFKGQVAVSRDGKRVALSESNRLRILDPSNGRSVQSMELPGYFPSRAVFSPDGNALASYHEGVVVLFDVRTGPRLDHDEQTPRGEPLSAAWSPGGDRIATGHSDGQVRLWDAGTGKLIWQRLLALVLHPGGKPARPNFVVFSRDGRKIIVGGSRDQSGLDWRDPAYSPGILAIHETSGNLLLSEFYPRVLSLVALSSDSKIIVVGPPDPIAGPSPNAAVLRGIEVPTGKTLWTSLPGERPPGLNRLAQRDLRALCFQPGSTALDVALEIGEVVRLDALTGKEQRRFLADWRSPEERRSPRSQWPWMWKAAFSSDGRVLATSADEFVYVWDVSAGKLRWSTRRPHQHCCTLALSPDGKALAAVDVAPYHGDWGKDAIRLYDTRSGEQFLTLDPAGDRVTTLAFSPDGARLFTAFYRTAALVWDVRRGPGGSPPTKSREP